MTLKDSVHNVWVEVKVNRNAYIMAFWGAMGGCFFGWDTGLIGGVLSEPAFQKSFGLSGETNARQLAALKGNIVSVLQAGCFFGAAASLYFPDRFGRKPSLMGATVIFLIGSIIQSVCKVGGQSDSSALNQLYVGRAIGGFGVGFASAIVPSKSAYISECAPRHIRGRLAGMYQLLNVFGIMLAFWINYGLQLHMSNPNTNPLVWRLAFIFQMIPGVFLLFGLATQPESPRWLVEVHRYEDARRSLLRLSTEREDPRTIRNVEQTLGEIVADKETRNMLSLWGQAKAACKDGLTFYRVAIAVIVMFFQQWTGTNSINYFSPQIFASLGVSGTSSGLFATGIYGVVKVVCTGIGLAFAMEQAGRKVSLMAGGFIQAISMFYIGAYQAIHPDGPTNAASYIAIVFVYIYVVGYSFGWGSVPWAVMAECAPTHVRSLAMALGLMTNWLFNFVIAKITPTLLVEIKYGTFLLFGCFSIVMIIWAAVFLPETGGLSLESIHTVFESESIIKRSIKDLSPKARREMREEAQRRMEVSQSERADESEIGSVAGRKRTSLDKGEEERLESV